MFNFLIPLIGILVYGLFRLRFIKILGNFAGCVTKIYRYRIQINGKKAINMSASGLLAEEGNDVFGPPAHYAIS